MELETLIEKLTLKNALVHKSTPRLKPIMNKILGKHPKYRPRAKELPLLISNTINRLKNMSLEDIQEEITQKYPDILEEIEQSENRYNDKKILPPLRNAIKGESIFRLPPEPSGYLHIGHAYSFYINYLYKEQYNGKLTLRFEDTNPKKVKLEYYDSIKETIEYLGVKYDSVLYESDHLNLYYDKAKQLIEQEQAFICTDDVVTSRYNRKNKIPSQSRNRSREENLELWDQMLNDMEEGYAVLRLKGDMNSESEVLRDPTIMRIIDFPHPRIGDKFRVYPLYDFAVSIEDVNITHVLRSEEFKRKEELQNLIRSYLGFPNPEYVHFSRLRLKNTPVAKRDIRELINKNIIKHWDDPRLSTVFGLRRRGIIPETLKELVYELNLSTSQGVMDWSIILSKNHKIIDNRAHRFFAAIDPVELEVNELESQNISLKNHPTNKELGKRKVQTGNKFWISKSDVNIIRNGLVVRLKDFCNVEILDVNKRRIKAQLSTQNTHKDSLKIQWVSVSENIPMKLHMINELFTSMKDNQLNQNSLIELNGYCEAGIINHGQFEVVQLERIGFACIDSINENQIVLNQT
ncbi:MAG: glutamate--tRNA ligase [Candidatus Hodarchaeales archaeon]|jgi:glutamyl-tRNA synthetase